MLLREVGKKSFIDILYPSIKYGLENSPQAFMFDFQFLLVNDKTQWENLHTQFMFLPISPAM